MTPQPPEVKRFKRNLSTARRELVRAVERFAEIDPLQGHRVEGARLAREVKAAADELVETLNKPL